MNRDKHSTKSKIVLLIIVVLIGYWLIHHFTKKKELVIPLPVVAVQKPQLTNMVEYVTQTGTTVAFNSINLFETD